MKKVKKEKKQKGKFHFRDMKLYSKISLIVGFMLTLVFVVLNVIIIMIASNAVSGAIRSDFKNMAKGNGQVVQEIINDADAVGRDIQFYVESAFSKAGTSGLGEKNQTSIAFPEYTTVSQLNADMEKYFISSLSNVAANYDNITGAGVFFEPFIFDEAIENYSLYMTTEDGKNGTFQNYGAYTEFSQNDWYKKAKEKGTNYYTDPYEDQGKTMVTGSYPIKYNGKVVAVVCVDIDITCFGQVTSQSEQYKTMSANVMTDTGVFAYDSEGTANIGKHFTEFMPNPEEQKMIQENLNSGKEFSAITRREDGREVSRFYYPVKTGDTFYYSQTVLDTKDLESAISSLTKIIVLMVAGALIAIVLVTIFVLKKMLKPIDNVVAAARSIENGDLDIKIDVNSSDEIGVLSQTFKNMAENLRGIINDINNILGEMANGNFRVKSTVQEKYIGEYGNILKAMRNINTNLSNTLSQINVASDQVNSGSDQVSSGAQELSQGATEQASSIEELSATITEITSQIEANAKNAQNANVLSAQAGKGVEESNKYMQEMIVAMQEISDKSNEIGKIIKTIDDIAFQTNILALNAAVEAARAGSAGKGFAVVADEVRNLAQKSAEAAKNTTALIEGSISAVANGTKIADETAKALMTVVEKSTQVSAMVDEISQASVQQADGAQQISIGVDQISSVVQTNSATAEESAAASEELSSQAAL
ncbi:MAG: methyl-accepting chemotaxis protein, partial [Oscillospiraceae bacterium]